MADETQSGDLTEQYLQSVEARKLEADRQMQKLIDALNVRKSMPFDPMLMRVAGALLSPTKTGSFGESLGYATTAAAEEAEKQAARGIDVAKLEFELGQKMREQQATAEQQKFAMQYLSQPQGQVPAQPAQLTAAPPVAAAELSAEPRMSTPEAPAVLPQEMPQAPAGGAPAGSYVPRQVDPRLAIIYPQLYNIERQRAEDARREAEFRLKERETLSKEAEQELKENTIILPSGGTVSFRNKERDRLHLALAAGDEKTINRLFKSKGVASPYRFNEETKAFEPMSSIEYARSKKLAETIGGVSVPVPGKGKVEIPANLLPAYDEAAQTGNWEKFNRTLRGEKEGAAAPVETKRPEFLSEEEIKRREERGKLEEKASAEQAETALNRARAAVDIRNSSLDLENIARESPRIYGLLQKPGIVAAIGRAVDANSTAPKIEILAEYKLNENERLALQKAAAVSARQKIAFRKLARTPGEGQTSDLETRMYNALAILTSDSPEIVRIKGEFMRRMAQFDEDVYKEFRAYQKKEGGSFQEFVGESKQYSNLLKDYEKDLETFRNNNAKLFTASQPKAPARSAPISGWRERLMKDRQ